MSRASLLADLAHAKARAARGEAAIRSLERRLSQLLGREVWAESGLGPDQQFAHVQRELQTAKQKLADLTAELEERTDELDAARAANRELMARLNTRQ